MAFDHFPAGAARFRLQRDETRVTGVALLDANSAFGPHAARAPALSEAFAAASDGQTPVVVPWGEVTATLHPVGPDEVVVLLDDRAALKLQAEIAQQRFETAFHGNAAAMVIARQEDLRILDVNARWLSMFGAERADVLGRTSTELGLITPEDATHRIAAHRALANGFDSELSLRTRAGVKLTVVASARPIDIPEGRCTLTTLIDITRRTHAEQAFVVAFNASPAGMVLSHATRDVMVSVNNRMVELSGYPREALVGKSTAELNLVRRPAREELLAEIVRAGRLDAVEIELGRADGSTVATLASTELVTLGDEPHRITVFTDITARKQLERRLVTQHEIGRVLANATEIDAALPPLLQAICRDERWACGAVWLPTDDDQGLRCRGLWLSPDAQTGAALADYTRTVVPVAHGGILGRVLARGEPEQLVLEQPASAHGVIAFAAGMRSFVAFPVLRGEEVLGVVGLAAREMGPRLDAGARSLYDSIGRMLGLFVERARAEANLRQLNAELERRVFERTHALANMNRDLEAFSSSVSHDLRAPLRAVQAFSQILAEDFATQLPDEAQALLHRITASAERMRELIHDLLDFARLGRADLVRTEVDFDAMVRDVVAELGDGRDLGDRLALTIHPLGTVTGDPSLLRAVWTNLVDNALKYSRGRARIRIEIGREQRGAEVVYYITDNGVGFDMTYATRLFGVFERLHAADEFEGTGIGLANVRRIVERHHGRVSATSQVDRGARFEFTLG